MAQIAGVDHEIGSLGQSVDLVDRYPQRRGDIRICGLIKTDVAVADLDKGEIPTFCGILFRTLGEYPRHGHARAQSPNQAGPRPCHTLQESATVVTVIVEIVQFLIDQLLVLICHFSSIFLLSQLITCKACLLFQRFAKSRLLTKKAASGEAACQQGGWLKNKLRLQLNHARRSVGSQSRAVDSCRLAYGRGDLSELAAVGVRIRKSKVRMIKQIKESRSNCELGSLPFGHIEGFLQAEIGVEVAGSTAFEANVDSAEGSKAVTI